MGALRWALLAALGIGGVAILLSLGVWQVQRLAWKRAVLADIDARIAAASVTIPAAPDPQADRYLPVAAEGTTTGQEIDVLISTAQLGAGYRVVVPFETGGRRILLDLGFVPTEEKDPPRPAQRLTATGNLHWPDETDRFTPAPDRAENIWFARDVAAMADALGTEPILLVARRTDPPVPGTVPLPVTSANIPNDHLGYAITWFSLAAIWAGMTALLGWRMASRRG
ncbi:surf1 family protein [Oceaniovalibus guishaninsula JLT2003]|uniref:SURF1-like protein n=1 Tax=Oceaniovalibus guishaninsula JLT2003 TaxID=1231392 RepID=K2HA53_9RHOB|nr:surf1 family protein [Oceaniovalibus guishaninsula JLT2003]